MKKNLLLLLLLSFLSCIDAQDIDIYKKNKNDNYDMPKIMHDMSYSEFKLLSQNIRMRDMMYALVVPGFIHYKAQENKSGNWLAGIRGTSYLTLGAIYWYVKDQYPNIEIKNLNKNNDQQVLQNIFYGTIGVIISTYIFDIIHGEVRLSDKQEKIRYKFSLKLSPPIIGFDSSKTPHNSLGIILNF